MNKYLHKFTSNIEIHDINLNNNTIKNILSLFYKQINDSHIKQHSIKFIETGIIKSTHDKNEYPVMYIYFKNLQKYGILEKIINNCPVFNDFKTFLNWYRLNTIHIQFNLIETYISNNNDINIQIIQDIHNKCFNSTGYEGLLYSKIYNNRFLSLDIQQDIETTTIIYNKHIINNKHNIHTFLFDKNDIPNYKYIATIIEFMEKIALQYNQPTPPVELCIIYTKQKKLINKNTEVLCADNINSGSTYPGIEITCWRKEEFYKVLIHELFHFYKFDFHSSSSSYNKLYKSIDVGTIEGTDSLNECYTECIAIILHSIYNAVLQNTNYDITHNYFKEFLNIELNFTLFQVSKIIVLFNGNTINDFFNHTIILKQNTSVRSYFIIKCLLLLNLNVLYSFISKSLIVNDIRLMEFGKLINDSKQQLLERNDIIEKINNFIKNINITPYNNWLNTTMRMTIHSL